MKEKIEGKMKSNIYIHTLENAEVDKNHWESLLFSTLQPDLQERPFSSTCSSASTVWSTGSQFTKDWKVYLFINANGKENLHATIIVQISFL